MATTFNVIFLGTSAIDIDPTEGNTSSEDMGLLVGTTFGSAGAALYDNVQTLSPVGSPGATYDSNNNPDQFSVDGTTYRFDGWGVYNVTITYSDGTTATAVAKIAQTTTGELYLTPDVPSQEANQALFEAKPIRTLTLNSTVAQGTGMTADRLDGNFIEPVDGTAGNDTMNVGFTDANGDMVTDGADIIRAGSGDDNINAGAGSDIIYGGAGNDVIDDWNGADLVYGGDGGDTINLSSGNDTVYMEGGHDSVRVYDNAGNNVLYGGTGYDVLDLHNWQSTTGASLTIGADGSGTFSHFSGATTGTFSEFEFIGGTAYNDTMNAATSNVSLALAGEGGDDVLISGAGDDVLMGDAGNDTLSGGAGFNYLEGGAGNDLVYGGASDDMIYGGDGQDTIYGDAVQASAVSVQNGNFAAGSTGWTVGGGGSTLVYSEAMAFNTNDTGTGGTVSQTVAVQVGLAYQVSVTAAEFGAGAGNHTLVIEVIDANGNVIATQTQVIADGTSQTITVPFTSGTSNVTLRFSNPSSTSTTTTDLTIDNITVTGVAPTGAGNDELYGGAGDDIIYGGAGNDTITGDIGNDTIFGGDGGDVLDGGSGNDQIFGGGGTDSLTGGAGDDALFGGIGNDTLRGGAGNDTVTTGDGADTVVLQDLDGSDVVTDFDLTLVNGKTVDQLNVSALTTALGAPVTWRDVVVTGTDGNGTGDAVLTFPGGESVILQGIAPSQVDGKQEMAQLGIPCFVAGSPILTPSGPRAVETLALGDLVETQNGPMRVIWTGSRSLGPADLAAYPGQLPIHFAAGAIGNSLPLRLSPQHAVQIVGPDGSPVLVRAKHMAEAGVQGVRIARSVRSVCYHHLLLERHSTVSAAGASVESMYPGPIALALFPVAARLAIAAAIISGHHADTASIVDLADLSDIYGRRCLPLLGRKEALLACSTGETLQPFAMNPRLQRPSGASHAPARPHKHLKTNGGFYKSAHQPLVSAF